MNILNSDWSKSHPGYALRCVPPLAMPLATLGMCLASWIGALAGLSFIATVAHPRRRDLPTAGFRKGIKSSLLLLALPENQWFRAVGAALFALFAWGACTLLWANYAYYAVCLTAYVVFLLSAGLNERELIEHRAAFTALGAACRWQSIGSPRAFFSSEHRLPA